MTTIGKAANEIKEKLARNELILPFIENDKLIEGINSFFLTVIKLYGSGPNIKEWSHWKFWKSGVDPFATIASSIIGKKTAIEGHFQEVEVVRQRDKSISNAIGDFHQKILGSLPDCINPGKGGGIDLIVNRPGLQFIAEIKNKWNTTKGDDRTQPYDKLKKYIETEYKGYTAYYVIMIAKPRKGLYKPINKPFTPAQKGVKREKCEQIREIDGKSLYALLTGRDDSLELLYKMFPKLIAYCLFQHEPQLAEFELIDKADLFFDYLWAHIYVDGNKGRPPKA